MVSRIAGASWPAVAPIKTKLGLKATNAEAPSATAGRVGEMRRASPYVRMMVPSEVSTESALRMNSARATPSRGPSCESVCSTAFLFPRVSGSHKDAYILGRHGCSSIGLIQNVEAEANQA